MRREQLHLTGEHLIEQLPDQQSKPDLPERAGRLQAGRRGHMFYVSDEEDDALEALRGVMVVPGVRGIPSRSDIDCSRGRG